MYIEGYRIHYIFLLSIIFFFKYNSFVFYEVLTLISYLFAQKRYANSINVYFLQNVLIAETLIHKKGFYIRIKICNKYLIFIIIKRKTFLIQNIYI
jgi:hypothetical protein